MLSDRVKCAVPNPAATLNVGSTVTLGAAPTGFRSFLSAFGGGNPAYFVLSDGNGKTITGVWTVNATTPETATITEIIQNDVTGGTGGETFSSACVAWNALPAREVVAPRSSPFAGLRNAIINGNPLVNQRAYVSGTATTGANQYTLDRWRVVVSGQSVSWTDSGGIRTVTAPAGGMEQVVEGENLIAGSYTINWTGTATCTVGGTSVAKGARITVTGGAGNNVTVRMIGGTWSRLQLEPGVVATPFEVRPLPLETLLCQRYFQNGVTVCGYPAYTNGTIQYFPVQLVRKRAVPTVLASASGMINIFSASAASLNLTDFYFDIRASVAGNCVATMTWTADSEL